MSIKQISHKPNDGVTQSPSHAANIDASAAPMSGHAVDVSPQCMPRPCRKGNAEVIEGAGPCCVRACAASRVAPLSEGLPSSSAYAHGSTVLTAHVAPTVSVCAAPQLRTEASSLSGPDAPSSHRVMLLRRMSGGDFPVSVAPAHDAIEVVSVANAYNSTPPSHN